MALPDRVRRGLAEIGHYPETDQHGMTQVTFPGAGKFLVSRTGRLNWNSGWRVERYNKDSRSWDRAHSIELQMGYADGDDPERAAEGEESVLKSFVVGHKKDSSDKHMLSIMQQYRGGYESPSVQHHLVFAHQPVDGEPVVVHYRDYTNGTPVLHAYTKAVLHHHLPIELLSGYLASHHGVLDQLPELHEHANSITSTVHELIQQLPQHPDLTPLLADALEDAGYTDQAVLEKLRGRDSVKYAREYDRELK